MPTQSGGQSVSAPRGKGGASLNAHTELRAKRQRAAREAMYRNRRINPVARTGWGQTHQGLTLVHFSAQLELFLTQNTP